LQGGGKSWCGFRTRRNASKGAACFPAPGDRSPGGCSRRRVVVRGECSPLAAEEVRPPFFPRGPSQRSRRESPAQGTRDEKSVSKQAFGGVDCVDRIEADRARGREGSVNRPSGVDRRRQAVVFEKKQVRGNGEPQRKSSRRVLTSPTTNPKNRAASSRLVT